MELNSSIPYKAQKFLANYSANLHPSLHIYIEKFDFKRAKALPTIPYSSPIWTSTSLNSLPLLKTVCRIFQVLSTFNKTILHLAALGALHVKN